MVRVKEKKGTEKVAEKVSFELEDYIAVKGLKGSYFEGETKAVHKVLGEKLIKVKRAQKVDAELEVIKNPNRIVQEVEDKEQHLKI